MLIPSPTIPTNKPLIAVLQAKDTSRIPVWFMRQAGRYLPEYRTLREQAGNFLDFCYTPSLAVEATLQPLKRFDIDAAIIFSDILVIHEALGLKVTFEENHGPRITPVTKIEDVTSLVFKKEKLLPVYEAIAQVAGRLPPSVALIGFAGAPWTLAAYGIEGKGSNDFPEARKMAYGQPVLMERFIQKLTDAVIHHCLAQIEAGAEIIQLFDSWAGLAPVSLWKNYIIKPIKDIVEAIHVRYPYVPVIGFPRGIGMRYPDYVRGTGVDAVSVDSYTSLAWLKNKVPLPLQGNLDPAVLFSNTYGITSEVERILREMRGAPFIFNLGHGILPSTPIAHVAHVIETVRKGI